jgi:hypothetical protein
LSGVTGNIERGKATHHGSSQFSALQRGTRKALRIFEKDQQSNLGIFLVIFTRFYENYVGLSLELLSEVVQRSILCPTSSETLSEARQLITEVRNFQPSKEELKKHSEFLKKINNPIWGSFS